MTDRHVEGTSFSQVDAATDPDLHVDWLDTYRRSAATRKLASIDLLRLAPGDVAIDVGCGTGEDAVELARRVAPTGRAFGFDFSAAMIEQATARAASILLPVQFQVAPAEQLPLTTGTVQGCRCERVLLHVDEPPAAVAEMVRVLAPGGRLVLVEPDFETIVFGHPDVTLSRVIALRAATSMARHWTAGRHLKRWLVESGLTDVIVSGDAAVLDFAAWEQIGGISVAAEQAVEAGEVDRHVADSWVATLKEQDSKGRFFGSCTLFTAAAKKPARRATV